MNMTIAAIVRDYEEAKDKRAQIQILADMNLCEKKEKSYPKTDANFRQSQEEKIKRIQKNRSCRKIQGRKVRIIQRVYIKTRRQQAQKKHPARCRELSGSW